MRYILYGNRKADLSTPVEHNGTVGKKASSGSDWLTLEQLHERGAIVRVRPVTFFNRVRPEYCADTEVHYHADGREKGASYIPIYRRTYDRLLASGLYDRETGYRVPAAPVAEAS